MDFVLVQKGQGSGPFTAEQIRQAIVKGEIDRDAKIWRAPWTSWVEVTAVFPADFGVSDDVIRELQAKVEAVTPPEENLYDRVWREVPSAQIEEILRKAKDLPEAVNVRISGKNKDELVRKHLQDAVARGYVKSETLESLVQELSETGGQRIFLYRAKSGVDMSHAKLSLNDVGVKLIGDDWQSRKFSLSHSLPNLPQVRSLRHYALPPENRLEPYGFAASKATGWILTIDTSVEVDEKIASGGLNGGNFSTSTYAKKLESAAVVIRYWEHLHIIELRVPNLQRRAAVTKLRDTIFEEFFSKLGLDTRFEEWTLANACTKAVKALVYENGKSEPTLRRVAGTHLREKDHSTMKMEIRNGDHDGILDSNARRESLEAYFAEKSIVESAIAYFQPAPDKEEIRVVIGADGANELSVRKIINAWYLDHVIFRLHHNS